MKILGAIASTVTIALVLIVGLALRNGGGVGADPQATAAGRDQPGPKALVVAVTPNPAEGCKSITVVKQIYADRSDPTIANRSEASVLVLVGSVESVQPGLWNTSSGAKPVARGQAGPDNPDTSIIYRPVTIMPTDVVRGKVATAPLTARWIGGQAGCDFASVDAGSALDLRPGARYAFFLGVSVEANGQYSSSPMILEAWPIDANDRIATPLEGNVTRASFTSMVSAAPMFNWTAP